MARAEEAVSLGPGYLYVAQWSAGAPESYTPLTSSEVVSDAPGGNFADVGYSEQGWNLVAANEFSDWTPAELVDPVVQVKDSQEFSFRGAAAQNTLTNIQIALGGGTITVESAGTVGSVDAIHKYVPPSTTGFDWFSVLFRVNIGGENEETNEGRVRDVYVPKVVSVASIDMPHNKGANPSLVALELRANKHTGLDPYTFYDQQQAV